MSKHVRVPAPIQKVVPRIIRSATGRLVLITGSCAALLAIGGSHYLLSHASVAPAAAQPDSSKAPTEAKVLGSTTTEHLDEATSASATTAGQPAPAPQPAQTTPKTGAKNSEASSEKASFEIHDIDASKISVQGNLILVPFEIEREGGLTGTIVPGNVDITVNSMLSSLVSVQSAVMTGPDTGVITLVNLGLGSNTMNVHFSATCGTTMASTSFTYKLKR